MELILRIENGIVKCEKALVAVLIALMIALSFLQLALRLFFHSGIVWLDPALRHMVLWAGLTGAALASRYSRHFAMDALVKFMPERMHRALAVLMDLVTALVAGALSAAAWKFIRDEFASGSVAFYIGDIGIKGGWAGLILPLVFLLAAFHSLMNLFRPAGGPDGEGTV